MTKSKRRLAFSCPFSVEASPVRVEIRDASTPFSTMYFLARSARVCASLAALGSFLSANPTITSLALGSLFKRRATSSPTRLQALSKRDAPALLYPQSPALAACGGGGGCCTSTLVEASAVPPRPSPTQPFTV